MQSTENKTEPRLDLDVLHYAITAHIQRLSEGNDARSDEPLVLTLQAASDALETERSRADRAESRLAEIRA